MHRYFALFTTCFLVCQSGAARQIKMVCGTSPEQRKEELHLHRQAERARLGAHLESCGASTSRPHSVAVDMGNVAILDDGDGVVARRNPFNLDQQTLTFTPSAALAARYHFRVGAGSYDVAAAASGSAVALGDDDSREVAIAFAFPFFGKSYQSVFVNSDGNLTFDTGDNASTDRSLGRMVAGPPRVAGLFRDLDPSRTPRSVSVASNATRLVVSWAGVPEYSDSGAGVPQTFQIRLYPDGRIQFAYAGVNTSSSVVGIAPGYFQGSSSVVSFFEGSSAEFSSTVAERFGGDTEIDIETATQKFFETHDDAYDYIAFLNDLDIPAGFNAVSWEETLRNNRSGYGDSPVDVAQEFGSAARLQSVLNMGPLSQFPVNPTDVVSLRQASGYNTLKLIAHEAGHLFLAYASVRDPSDPNARPMLGIQQAHWAFNFDAEASFMEGNRIEDNGINASPRYMVTADVDTYSPLDQYLMGFRAASEVLPTFLVTGNSPWFALQFPQVGITFNGGRRDIGIDEIIEAEGRRTPDSTIAQRHFRMAFVLIVKQGSTPSAAEVAQVENYRAQFEAFYEQSTGNRAYMDASLRRALTLSVSPAAGVLAGGAIGAAVSIQQPAASPLVVTLQAPAGAIAVPAWVVIPAGATSAAFTIKGMRQGVEEFSAAPADPAFETAYARVQVLPQSALQVSAISGNYQIVSPGGTLAEPVVFRVTDINNLFYPGAVVHAVASPGGSVTPTVASADANGLVSFQWTPGRASGAQLTVFPAGLTPDRGFTVTTLPPTTINPAGVVNAASFAAGLSPGALETIYGTTLAGGVIAEASLPWPATLSGVRVLVNGEAVQLLYVSDGQINFLAPADLAPGEASLTVLTAAGTSASLRTTVSAMAPGIFFDAATGYGAILNAGTSQTTQQQPAARGQFIEIYCTGLGSVAPNAASLMATVVRPQVFIGGVPASVTFSGLAPVFGGGLYQVDAQVPQNAASGSQDLWMLMNGVRSNSVKVEIQ